MKSNTNALLEIVTDLTTAMKVYPYIQTWKDDVIPNGFLRGMYIDFNEPQVGKAKLSCRDSVAPDMEWYVLFEDSEKHIQADEYIFYGVAYETTVEKAKQRLEKFIEAIENTFNTVNQKDLGKRKQQEIPYRRFWSRDRLKSISAALALFKKEDTLQLYFLYDDWPNQQKAEQTEYVRKFKNKILTDWTKELTEDSEYNFSRELEDSVNSRF
jgi:hypothetical protein